MIRAAVVILLLVIGSSYYFSHLPVTRPVVQAQGTSLMGVRLTLYPKADPGAYWVFSAAKVEQKPQQSTAVITGIHDGARYVDHKLDMTLSAPEVTVDANDNLQVPYATIYMPGICWTLELGGPGKTPVFINQRSGFSAPSVKLEGPGISMVGETFKADFSLKHTLIKNGRDTTVIGGRTEECKL